MATTRNLYLTFCLTVITSRAIGNGHAKCCMQKYHKHDYKFRTLTIMNMAAVWIFYVMCGQFHVICFCHSVNYTRRNTSQTIVKIFVKGIGYIAGHSGRAVWGVGLGRLVAGIVGSNPAEDMDVCPRLSVLCCPV
jgi:hypothetical protein